MEWLIISVISLVLVVVAVCAIAKAFDKIPTGSNDCHPWEQDVRWCEYCRAIAEEQGVEPRCAECDGKGGDV